MPVNYNFRKGTDLPTWDWLAQFPQGASNPGCGNAYDGVRYIYWSIQFSTSAGVGTAGTVQLWRYDTWTEDWQYLATPGTGNGGIDVEYDAVRNLVYLTQGNASTVMYVFNLNTTAVTVFNQSCAAWTLTTVTLALPVSANIGGSLTMVDDTYVHSAIAANPNALDAGTVAAGATTTNITDSSSNPGSFGPGQVGLQVRFTSGTNVGLARIITAVPGPTTLTTSAFPNAPAIGDTYVVEVPQDTAAAGSTTTTLVGPRTDWTVNQYAFSDVLITAGTGAGQRRRIASNTNNTLTLAAAVAGNARTGPWTTTPDATSVYRIVPSSDFLYYVNGSGSTAWYRIDVLQTTATAWVSLTVMPATYGPGGNTMAPESYAPFQIIALRGNGSSTVFAYNIGLNTWVTLTTFVGAETFNTGASAALLHGHRRMIVFKEGSQRSYIYDFTTGMIEGGPYHPYSTPQAYDGHRTRFVKTADGVEWLYHLRAGGQEFFRSTLEWLPS